MTEPRTREIQLTAKQLVFVFMSTVLVAVVIFLLGVWVGRGIGVDAPTLAQGATDIETGALKSPPPGGNGPAPPTPMKPPAEPPKFEYPKLLDGKASTTSPSAQPSHDAQAPTPPPASPPPPAPASPPPDPPAKSTAKPAAADGEGWVVQLGSYFNKANADKQAAQYKAKGYPVSVAPGKNFRVVIGPYPERSAADQVASRLRKEGQEVSVTRSR